MPRKVNFEGFFEDVKEKINAVDMEAIKSKAIAAKDTIVVKAGEAKDAAIAMKDELEEKWTELDRMLQASITEYNDAYTLMNDKGLKLFVERTRSSDSIAFVENLVNSIANRPKSFETDFEEIESNRKKFTESCDYASQELQSAREASIGAGVGLAAGASVAFMAPTAAMWVATTFGTASTGAAISTLTGAAASNAALAWLGGGALTAGGGGVVAGKALLALAGPIGWSIAGATLLTSIILFTSKRNKLNKQKNEEIQVVKDNTEKVREVDAEIALLLKETIDTRINLNEMLKKAGYLFGADYLSLQDDQKLFLGALINNTKSLSALFGKTVGM